ncbi:MAG: hypothetical protein KKG09_03140 [Verrucomicrobia bacterium]|nr:hypothetical protein [Verrucomicrobiota bacterium]MBU4292101.1 hypothetical protein [Verrucomicrobiota bacterium]MBU4430034.1 hypothetical protein [Verrucomicrobiota bacterium]MBU4496986.1 hypothetical protein [Verrucomicrobiota bacterium]MCG2681959.1 hypothetical protein [Kiritimatiellia bacterium]
MNYISQSAIYIPQLIAILLAAPVLAQMPIYEPLKTTASDHFLYIYQQSLEPQLPGLIKSCEDAHSLLAPVFNWTPRRKTVVMISDNYDLHNGWATVYPRPILQICLADAPPHSTIYEPGHYLRRTIFHEYAHLLSLDAQYGLDNALRRIFGRVVPAGDMLSVLMTLAAAPPALFAPTWYLEGLTTWAETEFVGPGRGRNAIADMILRMPVADRRQLPANQWDLHLPEWPYGDATYLYGMRTLEYAHDTYGTQAPERNVPGELSDSVAHSFFLAFDNSAWPVLRETFNRLAEDAVRREKDRQQERLLRLESVPLTPLPHLTPPRMNVEQPVFDAAGQAVFFIGHEEAGRDTLYRIDLDSRQVRKIRSARVEIDCGNRLMPAPDRQSIYFTRLDITGRDRLWTRLYRFDPATASVRLVTRTGRYRYPAISPDGKTLTAVRDAGGRQILIEVPLSRVGDREGEKPIMAAPEKHSLIGPAYSPDGCWLAYIESGQTNSRIHRIERASGQDRVILDWPGIIESLVFHPDSVSLVFSSDRTGVYNLYQLSMDGAGPPAPLTHVQGGLFDPAFSPDGRRLAAVAYDSYGPYLTVLDVASLPPITQPLPTLEPVWKSLAINERKRQIVDPAPGPAVALGRSYQSIREVTLDYWTPWLTVGSERTEGGLAASFSDPTAWQGLTLAGGAESQYATPVGVFDYRYAGWYSILEVFGAYGVQSYPDLVEDRRRVFYDYNETVGTLGLAATIPWPRLDFKFDLTLGYDYTDRSSIRKSEDKYRNQTLLTTNLFEGGEGSLFATLTYFNGTTFGRSASIEDGRLVSVTVAQAASVLGGDLDQTRGLGAWDEYISLPWLVNHVLKLEGMLGAGAGDQTAQGCFGLGGNSLFVGSAPQGMNRNVLLRGYDQNTGVGRNIVKASVAYRFPILPVYRGFNATAPFYCQQIFGEVFYDGGKAWGGEPDGAPAQAWIQSTGVELNCSLTLLTLFDIAPGIGAAYAFDREARWHAAGARSADKFQIYLSIKGAVNF